MIKINLATKKQAGIGATGMVDSGGLTKLSGIKISADDLRDLPLVRIALLLVVYFVGNYFLENIKQNQLAEVASQITAATQEKVKLNSELAKNQDFDQEKQRLEKDEIILKTKIETIEKLMAGRKDSIKVLYLVSQLLPKQVWIKDLVIRESEVKIVGRAVDYPDVNEFMKRVSESAFFTDLNTGSQKKVMDNENKIELVDFDFTATRRAAVTRD